MKKIVLKFVIAVVGMVLLAIGVNILIAVNLGLSAFDTLTYFVQALFRIKEFGNASFMLHLCFVIPILIILKINHHSILFTILSIISVFIMTRFVNYFSFLTEFDVSSGLMQLLVFMIGFIVLTLGVLFMAKANLIIPPYDKSVVEISKYHQIRIGKMRLICDVLTLVSTCIFAKLLSFNIPFSIGTLIITLFTGTMVQLEETIFIKFKKILTIKNHNKFN